MKIVRARPKVGTSLRETEGHDSIALCFTCKMLRIKPKAATSLRKTEHTIQMHCVLHGECSEPDATPKEERNP